MNLLERPTTGSVLVGGKDLTKLRDKLRQARQDISMIFQSFNLLMQRTALDNICFPWSSSTKRADAVKAPGNCWSWWAWATGPTPIPPSSPAARSSGWPSPGPGRNPKGPACDEATSALDPTTTLSILACC